MLDQSLDRKPLELDEFDELDLVSDGWQPDPDVRNHNGDPVFPDRVFFAPPPPEIGEIVTASSTLPVGKRPTSFFNRLLLVGFIDSLAVVLLNLLGAETLFAVLAVLVLTPLFWWLTRFKHTLRYVGKLGVARLTCKSRPERIHRREVFLFQNAAELRSGQTRQSCNGIYSGTTYHFIWKDASGKKVFKLNGSYHADKKPPKPKDPYHFAESAEMAWSIHLLDQTEQELEKTGSVHFRLSGKDWVAVGPGFLAFSRKGVEERWDRNQIGGLSIGDGLFKVKRIDAQEGWFSSRGVFQFPYATMSNARLFLITVHRMLGYSFQGSTV